MGGGGGGGGGGLSQLLNERIRSPIRPPYGSAISSGQA